MNGMSMEQLAMQKFMDDMLARLSEERSAKYMTLGKLLDELQGTNAAADVVFHDPSRDYSKATVLSPSTADSYRGYYTDLAFSSSSEPVTVEDFYNQCIGCLGKSFEGYKGGDYIMLRNTPVWCAEYGLTGSPIVAIEGTTLTQVSLVLGQED